MPNTYDPSTDLGRVRLLIADIGNGDGTEDEEHPFILSDESLQAFLDIEGGNVKLAAATAIDANALNEALASKIITTASGESTDGARLAQAMHQLAQGLRDQVASDDAAGGYFDVVDTVPPCSWPYSLGGEPELSGWQGQVYP